MIVLKQELNFRDFIKISQEANQFEKKINYLEKDKIDWDNIKENYKEILKHDFALSASNYKITQPIDPIETCLYRISKDRICKN